MNKKILLLFLFLAACTAINLSHPSLLESSNCSLPCWNNIVPGKTTKQEVVSILKNLPITAQSTLIENKNPWKFFEETLDFGFYQLLYPRSGFSIAVETYIIRDEVQYLNFCGDLGITLEEVIYQTGYPESVVTMVDNYAGGIWVEIINPSKGVDYSFVASDSNLSPESRIGCLGIFAPNIYEEMLEGGLMSMGHYDAAKTRRIMYPWAGYGDIEKLYPPRLP